MDLRGLSAPSGNRASQSGVAGRDGQESVTQAATSLVSRCVRALSQIRPSASDGRFCRPLLA
jgi:hypothetical protein